MSPYYTIMESPHRWSILAALNFGAACIGTVVMLSWGWAHWLCTLWFYAGTILALVFAFLAVQNYFRHVVKRNEQGDLPN